MSRNSVIELNYIQTGLAWIKLGDIPFSSLSAGRDILESARSFMEQNDGWVSYELTLQKRACTEEFFRLSQGLTSGLSRVLQKVQERAQSESSSSDHQGLSQGRAT